MLLLKVDESTLDGDVCMEDWDEAAASVGGTWDESALTIALDAPEGEWALFDLYSYFCFCFDWEPDSDSFLEWFNFFFAA